MVHKVDEYIHLFFSGCSSCCRQAGESTSPFDFFTLKIIYLNVKWRFST